MFNIYKNTQTEKLANIYWLGGGSGSGKTTLAQNIKSKYNVNIYDTDAAMMKHVERSSASNCTLLHKFLKMSLDERWVLREPQQMFESFHWYQGEGFQFIIDDLLAMPADKPILVEGFRLLPELVYPHLQETHKAVWLLPTPHFRKKAFEQRNMLQDFPSKTSNPNMAMKNLLQRDGIFTNWLEEQVTKYKLRSVTVDENTTQNILLAQVADLFNLKE